jgi:hypothetical protein
MPIELVFDYLATSLNASHTAAMTAVSGPVL